MQCVHIMAIVIGTLDITAQLKNSKLSATPLC